MENQIKFKNEIPLELEQGGDDYFHEEDEIFVPLEDPLDVGEVFEKKCGTITVDTGVLPTGKEDEGMMEIEDVLMESKSAIVKVEQEEVFEDYSDGNQEDIRDESGTSSKLLGPEVTRKKLNQPRCYICTICHLGLPDRDAFQNHLNTAHADRFKYPCRHCKKKFSVPANRDRHETIHDVHRFEGEAKFECEICQRKYHLRTSLQSHIKKYHLGYKPPKKRPSTAPVIEHHSIGVRAPPNKKVVKLHECPHCDLKFPMRCAMLKHTKVHNDIRTYPCKECDERFKDHQTLRAHIRRRHNEQAAKQPLLRPRSMSGQPCVCKVCQKVFPIPSRLERHMSLHTGEKRYKCSYCEYSTRLQNSLVKHENRHRKNPMLSQKCLLCGKQYSAFNELRSHRVTTHKNIPYTSEKEKPFGCYICGKPYFTKGEAAVCTVFGHDPTSLIKYMFRVKCSECSDECFGYHSTAALRKHWETAHSEHPIPAKYRQGMYDGNGNLRVVTDTLPYVIIPKEESKKLKETGVPPEGLEHPLWIEFDLLKVDPELLKKTRKVKLPKEPKEPERHACPECEMTFCSRSNVKRHLEVVHGVSEDKKPTFQVCTICGMKVAKGKLRNHLYTHSISPYKCEVCDKTFRKAKQFQIHKMLHLSQGKRRPGRPPKVAIKSDQDAPSEKTDTTPKPFPCPVCGKGFLTWRAAFSHEVRAHRSSRKRPMKINCKVSVASETFRINENEYENVVKSPKMQKVNVNDTNMIRDLLGDKELRVELWKL